MNILWIYNQPIVPEAGGTERISSLIAKGFSLQGNVCLGALVFNEQTSNITYNETNIIDLYDFLHKNDVDIVINQIAYKTWLLSAFLDNGGRKWIDEGGTLISCLHFDPQNPSLLYLLRSKQQKNLFDLFNMAKAYVLQRYYRLKQQRAEGDIYNYIYDHSRWFVVLSKTHIPYMHKVMKRDSLDKLIAINNPLTFDNIMQHEDLHNKKNVVLVCARMSEYHKRISFILKAWSYIQKDCAVSKDWVLKIVGEGPDLQNYKDFVTENRVTNIIFEGHQYPEPYYHEAKILLLTSSAEGWGLTITEGLQNGVVPIVMNSSSVFSEIIQSGYNGYLTPNNNIKAFAKQLKELMLDPETLMQKQRNAIDSAGAFSLNKTMGKWSRIIN